GTQILRDGVPFRAVGGNTFNLGLDFTGGSSADRPLSVDMATKILADAHERGLVFLRFSVIGYGKEDFERWLADPATFDRRLHELCDRARDAGVLLVPSLCWRPASLGEETGEGTGALFRDPGSR